MPTEIQWVTLLVGFKVNAEEYAKAIDSSKDPSQTVEYLMDHYRQIKFQTYLFLQKHPETLWTQAILRLFPQSVQDSSSSSSSSSHSPPSPSPSPSSSPSSSSSSSSPPSPSPSSSSPPPSPFSSAVTSTSLRFKFAPYWELSDYLNLAENVPEEIYLGLPLLTYKHYQSIKSSEEYSPLPLSELTKKVEELRVLLNDEVKQVNQQLFDLLSKMEPQLILCGDIDG